MTKVSRAKRKQNPDMVLPPAFSVVAICKAFIIINYFSSYRSQIGMFLVFSVSNNL